MGNNFIERLQYYMKLKGINDNQMTIAAGLSVGLLGKLKKSGKGMNSSNIEKILYSYPEINASWLLTGKGEMLVSHDTPTDAPSKPVIEVNDKDIKKSHIAKNVNRKLPTKRRVKRRNQRKIANVLLGSKNYRREVWRASHSYLPVPWRAHSLPISPSWSTNASTISYQTSRAPTFLSG